MSKNKNQGFILIITITIEHYFVICLKIDKKDSGNTRSLVK